jgi:putative peptidoglycan lipid II flippase
LQVHDSSNAGGPLPAKSNSEADENHAEASSIASETIEQVGDAGIDSPIGETPTPERSSGKSAFLVGAGILISRILGLIRQRVFAHYFGLSAAGDAFSAAFRIPNFLQNIFGEGALSASFIPVYAKLLAQQDEEEATRVANAVLGLLALAVSLIVLAGVLATPYFISVIAPGFEGETRELTIRLVRILFPGAGLLVLSAWCLGVLNSHHRFFLSYTAPVAWNLAMIVSLMIFGRRVGQFPLAEYVAWGSVLGSALQFGVQLPTVLKLVRRVLPTIDVTSDPIRSVIRNYKSARSSTPYSRAFSQRVQSMR